MNHSGYIRCKYFASYMRQGDEKAAEDHTRKVNWWLSKNDDIDIVSFKTHLEGTMIITELWYGYGYGAVLKMPTTK